jgi:hypothetical protein
MTNDTLGLACDHGMLARCCEVCEMQNEITALRTEVERLERRDAIITSAYTGQVQETERLRNLAIEGWDKVEDLRARLAASEETVRGLRGAVQNAYGFLWCVNSELGTPHQYSAERAAYEARKVLRDLLTHEQIGAGINSAIAVVRATPLLTGAAAGEGEA